MGAPTDRDLAQAYQYCLNIARQHYENFPTASRLIRKDLRPAVAAIYAFARHADDIADEGHKPAPTRLKQLDAWETLLERCDKERLEQPVFLALGDAILRFDLPVEELHKLLIAFRMDVSLHAYASEDELYFYCAHSANPVGRLMLALHGIHDGEAWRASDAICTALQMVNFWQDLSVDLPRGRCYLPETWLNMQQLESRTLLEQAKGDMAAAPDQLQQRLKRVLEHAVLQTRQRLQAGYPLLPMLPWRLRLQIAATLKAAEHLLASIESESNILGRRPKLGRSDWWRMLPGILRLALAPKSACRATPALAGERR